MRFPLLFLIVGLSAAVPALAQQPAVAGPLVLDRVRFYPAPGLEKTLVGGKFEGSNVSPEEGYQPLGEITEAPAPGQWGELKLDSRTPYRWIRYTAPAGDSAVGKMEFYAGDYKLPPPGGILDFRSFGVASGGGLHEWRKVFDGNLKTWAESDHLWFGVDLRDKAGNPAPVFSPVPGDLTPPVTMAISGGAPGCSIRYTLDGTLPTATTGVLYTTPIGATQTTTLTAVAFKDGLAPSPETYGTYLLPAKPGRSTLHVGNSLTNITYLFPKYVRTAGYVANYDRVIISGSLTKQLWDTYGSEGGSGLWQKKLDQFTSLDDFTLQPRDFNIPEEATYVEKFCTSAFAKFPQVQPWLYAEWVEADRQRPTDKGTEPTSEMTHTYPALTWEESMSAMLLYLEDVQKICGTTRRGRLPDIRFPGSFRRTF